MFLVEFIEQYLESMAEAAIFNLPLYQNTKREKKEKRSSRRFEKKIRVEEFGWLKLTQDLNSTT
jgi:hypothetical protein